jgi:hypothetical protein
MTAGGPPDRGPHPDPPAPPEVTRPAWIPPAPLGRPQAGGPPPASGMPPGGGPPPAPGRPPWPPAPPGGPGWGRPDPPPPPRRRRPLVTLLVLLLVTVLAGAGVLLVADRGDPRPPPASAGAAPGGGAAPTTTRPSAAPERTPAAIRAVQAEVAELRGLRFRRPVPATLEPPARLARRLLRIQDAETDEADLARTGRALAVLGELPLGTDLPQLLRRIQAESVLGFYLPGRPPKGRLYVRSSRGLDPSARVVLAHELTHAVTDQHYDLTRSDRLSAATGREDEAAAYAALVEGDARLTQLRYLRERLTPAEQASAGQASAGDRTPRRDAAPAVIRESLLFPYREGLRFAILLYQQGRGWSALNRAYRDPPSSTEQVLHPDKYLLRRDRPQALTVPDLSGQLGGGWRPGTQLGFGELDARLLLQGELPATAAAAAAAEGWDGGRLRTFERAGRTALLLRTVWDSRAEAAEFCGAMTRWATTRFGPPTTPRRWSGAGQHAALRCSGPRVALLTAPDRPTLQRLLATTPRP